MKRTIPFKYIYNFQISMKNGESHRIIRLTNISVFIIFLLTVLYSFIYYFILDSANASVLTFINSLGYLLYYPIFKKYSFSSAIIYTSFYFLIHLFLIVVLFASPQSGFQLYFFLIGPMLHLVSIKESNKRLVIYVSILSFFLFLFCELIGPRFATLSLSSASFRFLYFSSVTSVFFLLLLINIVYRKEIDTREKRLNKKNIKLSNLVKLNGYEIRERKKKQNELEAALSEVQTLSGLLPICASCKSIRDDQGYWKKLETYIENNTDAIFSHGLCPDCTKKLYPEQYEEILKEGIKKELLP